ncbi:hypothetical protein CS229P3_00024 [Clostridium phage CS229P3]|nr:hypothetical protein CS229P1_00001 [Clostridium phage CS229P1]WAX12037.1 hypothetical protein CS229P2_00024 [Clostridium phage CS229P2]WAX12061.1 hypothetical protein CS229P3_00024 [Clostridium phage CS229P3]
MINDGIGSKDFTVVEPFAFWTQHVLPLVYGDEISYMETLGKMRDILNELIKNNNNLPDYIQQMIEEYITSGAIEEVINNILSSFILNVKYPPIGVTPAKGDGTTNDHDAIQGCIDYAASKGGGLVYLPSGKYLTGSLVLKSGVTLLGFGRYAVSLVLAGGATTHLITGTVSDAGLINLTLDAKMSSQVNRVDAVELVGNHIDIKNIIARDCYTSINIQKDGTAVNISSVLCEVASDACLRIGGTDGGLLVDGLEMTGLSTNLGVAYIVTDSNGDIYRNINIHGTGALGIDVAGSQNYFDGKISGVSKDYEDLGSDNTFELFGKSSVKNYTNAYTVNAKDVVLNPTNPLTYKTPTPHVSGLSYVEFKDTVSAYKVVVSNNMDSIVVNPNNTVRLYAGIGGLDITSVLENLTDDTTLILTKGTYYTAKNNITVSANNIVIQGDDGVLIRHDFLGNLIKFTGNNIAIKNVTFDATNKTPDKSTIDNYGYLMFTGLNLYFDKIIFKYFHKIGIYVERLGNGLNMFNSNLKSGWTLAELSSTVIPAELPFGIYCKHDNTNEFLGCNVFDSFFEDCSSGIYIGSYNTPLDKQGSYVSGCHFKNIIDHGIYFNSTGPNMCVGNYFYQCHDSAAFEGGYHVYVGNQNFGNPPFTAKNIGVSMRDAYGCIVSNNVFAGFLEYDDICIDIVKLLDFMPNQLDDNLICNNVLHLNKKALGIALYRNTTTNDVSFNNNRIEGNTIITNGGDNVLRLTKGEGNIIRNNNIVIDTTIEPKNLLAITSCNNTIIENNIFRVKSNLTAQGYIPCIALDRCETVFVNNNMAYAPTGFGNNCVVAIVSQSESTDIKMTFNKILKSTATGFVARMALNYSPDYAKSNCENSLSPRIALTTTAGTLVYNVAANGCVGANNMVIVQPMNPAAYVACSTGITIEPKEDTITLTFASDPGVASFVIEW